MKGGDGDSSTKPVGATKPVEIFLKIKLKRFFVLYLLKK